VVVEPLSCARCGCGTSDSPGAPVFRREMQEHVGPIRVTATPTEIRLEARRGQFEQTLLRAAGLSNKMVAGARTYFHPQTVRIRLT